MSGKSLFAVSLGFILAGCAVLPDATVTYYLPKSGTTIAVTQTVACDSKKNTNVTVTLTAKSTYSADYSDDGKKTVPIKNLDGALSDTDVDFSLTEDGRLKGINSSQTGQATTVIKDAVTVAATAAVLFGAPVGQPAPWCGQQGSDKPVTITYNAGPHPLHFAALVLNTDTPQDLRVDSSSQALFDAVSPSFPRDKLRPKLVIHAAQHIQPVAEAPTNDGVPVVLPRMYKVALELFWGLDENLHPVSVATQDIYLPSENASADRTFTLHIPPSAWFGTQKFILTLADSGAVTDIHYVKTTGAAGALEAGQAVLSQLKPESTTDQANAVKAQADLIYEQQRLAACRASPSVNNCK